MPRSRSRFTHGKHLFPGHNLLCSLNWGDTSHNCCLWRMGCCCGGMYPRRTCFHCACSHCGHYKLRFEKTLDDQRNFLYWSDFYYQCNKKEEISTKMDASFWNETFRILNSHQRSLAKQSTVKIRNAMLKRAKTGWTQKSGLINQHNKMTISINFRHGKFFRFQNATNHPKPNVKLGYMCPLGPMVYKQCHSQSS